MTDNKIDYYIEVSTGSKILASYGTKDSPVTVKVNHPKQGKSILWLAALILGVAAVVKVVATQRAYYKKERRQAAPNRKKSASKKFSGHIK